MIQVIAFWALATITVLSALFVVIARNPVRSVMWLILTFFTSAALFVLLGAEFLAMLLVLVYVGAVAVLFLFVVMMLDVDFVEMKQGFMSYLPMGMFLGLILLAELIMVSRARGEAIAAGAEPNASPGDLSNIEAFGQVLYTDYVYVFEAAGLVLLVAMIGAIVLTLRHREGVKKQNVAKQVGRRRDEGVELVDIKPGQGMDS